MCKEKEPGSRKECVSCRRMMIPTRHLPDGTYLCQTCAPKKLQTCCLCGRRRRANALTADGPVCGTCYASPARRCGICEQVGPIRVRAKGEAPDICYRCYVRPEKLQLPLAGLAWDAPLAVERSIAVVDVVAATDPPAYGAGLVLPAAG
ncbi:hypothetical protein [Streptomyces avermitilis]|uniref:hypothetical protein n=1 Tax=Streptomyces avermitilis TaxID=33903 RepID=UPI0033C22AA3